MTFFGKEGRKKDRTHARQTERRNEKNKKKLSQMKEDEDKKYSGSNASNCSDDGAKKNEVYYPLDENANPYLIHERAMKSLFKKLKDKTYQPRRIAFEPSHKRQSAGEDGGYSVRTTTRNTRKTPQGLLWGTVTYVGVACGGPM